MDRGPGEFARKWRADAGRTASARAGAIRDRRLAHLPEIFRQRPLVSSRTGRALTSAATTKSTDTTTISRRISRRTISSGGEVYPGFLVYQGFETLDGNVRLSLHPWSKVMLVSRYEYQTSTIRTEPDPASGLSEVDASRMHTHISARTRVGCRRMAVPAGRIQLRRQRDENAGLRLHPVHPQRAKQLLDGQFQFQFRAGRKDRLEPRLFLLSRRRLSGRRSTACRSAPARRNTASPRPSPGASEQICGGT